MADNLTNMGVEQDDKMTAHIISLDVIIPLFETDMRGVAFERFVYVSYE